jgi:hypothetical protein
MDFRFAYLVERLLLLDPSEALMDANMDFSPILRAICTQQTQEQTCSRCQIQNRLCRCQNIQYFFHLFLASFGNCCLSLLIAAFRRERAKF